MRNNQQIFMFFYKIIKNYKIHFLIMIQAPIIHSMLLPLQALCFKLFIDHQTKDEFFSYHSVAIPIIFYITLNIIHGISWRLKDFFYSKSQPYVRESIVIESYKKIQEYSFQFFQITPVGSIVSKIKSISDGYDNVINFITDTAIRNVFCILISISMCYFVKTELFLGLLMWSILFFIVMMFMYSKESKIAYQESKFKHQLSGIISDNIANIFTILAFSKKNIELKKLKHFTQNYSTQKDYEGNIAYTKVHCIGFALYLPMLFIVLFYLIHLKINNIITISDFIFVLTNISIMLEQIYSFVFDLSRFMKNFSDFKESCQILTITKQNYDKNNAKELVI